MSTVYVRTFNNLLQLEFYVKVVLIGKRFISKMNFKLGTMSFAESQTPIFILAKVCVFIYY